MTYSVVTTFNQEIYQTCGKNMLNSFDKNWPLEVNLYVFTENFEVTDKYSDRIHFVDLLNASPDLVNLKERWKNNPMANGFPDEITEGVEPSFRYNAVKFAHKIFAIISADNLVNTDILIWMDADINTFREIPIEFLSNITPVNKNELGHDHLASYIGREIYVTECGYVAYNRNHYFYSEMMNIYRKFYMDDTILNFSDRTDCGAFDIMRMTGETIGVKFHNLGLNVKVNNDHYFINTILGQYMDHLKGKRKLKGSSHKKEIVNPINAEVEYWKNLKL